MPDSEIEEESENYTEEEEEEGEISELDYNPALIGGCRNNDDKLPKVIVSKFYGSYISGRFTRFHCYWYPPGFTKGIKGSSLLLFITRGGCDENLKEYMKNDIANEVIKQLKKCMSEAPDDCHLPKYDNIDIRWEYL